MKNTLTLKSVTLIALLGAALAAPVMAQTGYGMGGGPGMQNGAPGAGMGPGAGGRGMRFNQNNTRGWTLMTPEERTAHQNKMRAAKTYDECKSVQADQHALMEERAKEKGETLPVPRQNGCDVMKSRGYFK